MGKGKKYFDILLKSDITQTCVMVLAFYIVNIISHERNENIFKCPQEYPLI